MDKMEQGKKIVKLNQADRRVLLTYQNEEIETQSKPTNDIVVKKEVIKV